MACTWLGLTGAAAALVITSTLTGRSWSVVKLLGFVNQIPQLVHVCLVGKALSRVEDARVDAPKFDIRNDFFSQLSELFLAAAKVTLARS